MKNQQIVIGAAAVVAFLLLTRRAKATGSSGSADVNVLAFLKTIQYAEGTFSRPNPYAVTYGYSHTIQDFSDHPAITGEWTGKTLPESYCYSAGLTPPCKSTAAGAYQMIKPTWVGIKSRLGNIGFGKQGQDFGALDLIKRRGALADVSNGNFSAAIEKLNTTWASLPGSPYGQPTKSLAQLKSFYLSQGGLL